MPSGPGPMPLSLLVSTGLGVAVVGASLAHRAFWQAGLFALAALLPVVPKERHRAAGVFVAWVGVLASVVSIVLVPMGARVTAVYLPALVVLFARIAALRGNAVKAWVTGRKD